MSLADDLLAHAERLLDLDPRRPKQATLRRAISAAYYSLFHLLTSEAAGLFAGEPGLAAQIGRSLNHGEMKKASQSFSTGQLPKSLKPAKGAYAVPPDLKIVAETFIVLQTKRHLADYDLAQQFRKEAVQTLAGQARQAFEAWARIRKSDDARLYLACFLLWKRWDDEPR